MPGKRILVADDDELILLVLELAIEYLLPDSHVITAQDGLAALIELQKASFDLVFTDYNMPHINGLTLAQAIQKISPETLIVLMTSDCSQCEIQIKADSIYLDGFLPKPFTMPNLKKILQETWNIDQ